MIVRLSSLLRNLFRRNRVERALDEELQASLSLLIEERVARGVPPAEARRAALAELGGVDQLKTRVRDARAGAGVTDFARDLRWAARGVRARGWTAVLSVLLLATAMAASTLVFSSADALLFNRVPYPKAEELVTVRTAVRPPIFEALRHQSDLFRGVSAHQPSVTFVMTATGPLQVPTAFVTPGLFETLGILPKWGRPLVEADRTSISPTLAVIDAGLAADLFGKAAEAVGGVMTTADRPLTIAGVMPPGFRFPDGRVRIWRALDHQRLTEEFPSMSLVARVASGRPLSDVSAVLATRLPEFARKPTAEEFEVGLGGQELQPYASGPVGTDRVRMLRVLLGAALCLLLAACANVASLELAAGIRRTRLFSLQRTLGASRGSLVRSALLEGAALVSAASAIALAVATLGASAMTSMLPETITLGSLNPIDVDNRAVALLLAIAAPVWLVASLPVVIYASRADLMGVMKNHDRGATATRAGSRVRQIITTAEVALAVLLLVGGLLYLRTYAAFLAIPTGMETRGVVSLSVTMPLETYSAAAGQHLTAQLMDRLRGLSQVVSVSRVSGSAPPGNAFTMRTSVELEDGRATERAYVSTYTVDSTFFATMGIVPLRGRIVDANSSTSEVVITDSFARFLWPEGDPIGRSFRLGSRYPWLTVAAVIPHVRTERDDLRGPAPLGFSFFRLADPPRPLAAAPASQPPAAPPVNAPSGALFRSTTILVRLEDAAQAGTVLSAARSVDPRARYTIQSLDEIYAKRHAEARMASSIVSGFAGVALLIAIAGVFGVMTFLVNSRTREIGIRMALGAAPGQVSRFVLASSLWLILLGLAVGLAAALAAARYIESQLFGVTPTDPVTLLSVAAVVAVAATLATWHPARRASRVDPAITLRAE